MNNQDKEFLISAEHTNTITNQNGRTVAQEESLNYFTSKSSKSKKLDTTFMLDEVIADSISRLSKIQAPKGIELVFEMNKDAIVYARRDIVCCLIRNLITNIVQFGSDGEKIAVSSKVIHDKVIVSISNSGGEINPNNIHYLLQENKSINNFSKTEEIIARIELLLCRQFAEENNSYLSVIYGDGQDTLFTFPLLKSSMNIDENTVDFHIPTNSSIHWHSGF